MKFKIDDQQLMYTAIVTANRDSSRKWMKLSYFIYGMRGAADALFVRE